MPDCRVSEEEVVAVTRLEVIDKDGRAYVNWEVSSLQLHLQDDGRTLKLFVT